MQSATLDSVIEGARQYLHTRRSADGLWHDFMTLAGEAVDWPSGYILDALCQAGTDQDFLAKSAIILISRQHPDGGWGYHYGVPTDADSTATVLLFLNRLKLFPNIAHKAAQCLLRFQNDFGGIATYHDAFEIRQYLRVGPQVDFSGWCQACCEVTARAGRALLSTGPQYESAILKAWEFLKSRQLLDGSWEPYWWTSAVFTTAEAAAFAAMLGDRDAVRGAGRWIAERKCHFVATSTEPCAFIAALCVQILLFAGHDAKDHAKTIDYFADRIGDQQNSDGGWQGTAALKIPPPHATEPGDYEPWRVFERGTGVATRDHRGLFTSATVLSALASLRAVRE